jgi:hypothetical protein
MSAVRVTMTVTRSSSCLHLVDEELDECCQGHDDCYRVAGVGEIKGIWLVPAPIPDARVYARVCDRVFCHCMAGADCGYDLACNAFRALAMGVFCANAGRPEPEIVWLGARVVDGGEIVVETAEEVILKDAPEFFTETAADFFRNDFGRGSKAGSNSSLSRGEKRGGRSARRWGSRRRPVKAMSVICR